MTPWRPDISSSGLEHYRAIVEVLARDIASGQLRPGDRLPPQRSLAADLGLAVGTISKAYAEASRRGYLRSGVGSGTFVREHPSLDPHRSGQARADRDKIDLAFNTSILGPLHSEALRATLASLSRSDSVEWLLRYHRPWIGREHHREAAAAWVRQYGITADPAEVAVVCGSQHAASAILLATAKAGDLVVTSDLSDPLSRLLIGALGLKLIGLESDEEGIRPDAFEAVCRVENVRILHCMPDHHSPTMAVMSSERRQAIAEIAVRYEVTIVECAVYRPMMETAPPPLATFAPQISYWYTSLSKIVAPGPRIGFVVAPRGQADNLILGMGATTWMTPPLTAEIAATWIGDGTASRIAEWQLGRLRSRNTLLRKTLAGFSVSSLPTGLHAWLQLPRHWRASAFAAEARTCGVLVREADNFATALGPVPQAVRISLGGAVRDDEKIETGLATLVEILNRRVGSSYRSM